MFVTYYFHWYIYATPAADYVAIRCHFSRFLRHYTLYLHYQFSLMAAFDGFIFDYLRLRFTTMPYAIFASLRWRCFRALYFADDYYYMSYVSSAYSWYAFIFHFDAMFRDADCHAWWWYYLYEDFIADYISHYGHFTPSLRDTCFAAFCCSPSPSISPMLWYLFSHARYWYWGYYYSAWFHFHFPLVAATFADIFPISFRLYAISFIDADFISLRCLYFRFSYLMLLFRFLLQMLSVVFSCAFSAWFFCSFYSSSPRVCHCWVLFRRLLGYFSPLVAAWVCYVFFSATVLVFASRVSSIAFIYRWLPAFILISLPDFHYHFEMFTPASLAHMPDATPAPFAMMLYFDAALHLFFFYLIRHIDLRHFLIIFICALFHFEYLRHCHLRRLYFAILALYAILSTFALFRWIWLSLMPDFIAFAIIFRASFSFFSLRCISYGAMLLELRRLYFFDILPLIRLLSLRHLSRFIYMPVFSISLHAAYWCRHISVDYYSSAALCALFRRCRDIEFSLIIFYLAAWAAIDMITPLHIDYTLFFASPKSIRSRQQVFFFHTSCFTAFSAVVPLGSSPGIFHYWGCSLMVDFQSLSIFFVALSMSHFGWLSADIVMFSSLAMSGDFSFVWEPYLMPLILARQPLDILRLPCWRHIAPLRWRHFARFHIYFTCFTLYFATFRLLAYVSAAADASGLRAIESCFPDALARLLFSEATLDTAFFVSWCYALGPVTFFPSLSPSYFQFLPLFTLIT